MEVLRDRASCARFSRGERRFRRRPRRLLGRRVGPWRRRHPPRLPAVKVDDVVRAIARRSPDPRLGLEHLVEVSNLVFKSTQRGPCEFVLGAHDAHDRGHFRAKPEARSAIHVATAVAPDAHHRANAVEARDDLREALPEELPPHLGCVDRLDFLGESPSVSVLRKAAEALHGPREVDDLELRGNACRHLTGVRRERQVRALDGRLGKVFERAYESRRAADAIRGPRWDRVHQPAEGEEIARVAAKIAEGKGA